MKITSILFLLLAGIVHGQKSPFENNPKDLDTLDEIIEFYKQENLDSLRYFVDLGFKENKKSSVIYLDLVEGYLNFNENEKAKKLLDSLGINRNVDGASYARALTLWGKIFNRAHKNELALQAYYEALEVIKSEELNFLEPIVYFEIASVLRENNDLSGTSQYYRYAFEKAKINNDLDLQVRSYTQMCKVYNGWITVNLDSSVYYGELAMNIAKEANYEFGYISALSIVAAPIIRIGQVRRGLQMSREALRYADKYNFSPKDKYFLTLNLGFAYETLKQYDSALFYKNEAATQRPQSIDHFRLEYLIYKSQGRSSKALKAFELYSEKRDSTVRRRNESNLSLAQARYETDLKEKEVSSLSQQAAIQALEIQQKNQTMVIGLVVILFVLVAIYFMYKQREIKKQQSQTELEQRFLRSQLNPHFISNALVAVQSFMLKNDAESAAIYLTKFSKLMREILENSRKEFIPVEEEINMLKNYLDIHKLRLGSFDYSIELDENIDPEVDTIPPMFVQPFVENAIEHGIANLDGGIIELNFKKDGDYISILVNDNGKGLLSNSYKEHNSLSSTIIQERMELFNKSLKRKIQLVMANIKNEKGEVSGTKVELKVPFSYI